MPQYISRSAFQSARGALTGAVAYSLAAFGVGAGLNSVLATPSYAQKASEIETVGVGPSSTAPEQRPISIFTEKECRGAMSVLLSEMQRYRPRPGDPESMLTDVLPKSAMAFVGNNPNKPACVGVLNWKTRGEKSVLDAVIVGLSLSEDMGRVPKGIAKKFNSVIPDRPVVASIAPQKTSAPGGPSMGR